MCVFPAPVPLPISVSSFSLSCHDPSHLSLIVPLPCFHLPRFLFFFLSVPFLFVLFFLFSPFSLFSLHPLSFSVLFFFVPPFSCVLALGGIYRAKGNRGILIAALLLRMGSRALLPCHGARRGGQWVWLAGRGSPGFSS